MRDSEPVIEYANAAARHTANCLLSILIPVYNCDPNPLVRSLLARCSNRSLEVEIVAADDGSDDPRCFAGLLEQTRTAVVACRLLVMGHNVGRSKVRNKLCQRARGLYLLYLDGDVRIESNDFLLTYLNLIEGRPDVVVGGFREEDRQISQPQYRLYTYVNQRMHRVPLSARNANAAKYVFTSNLLVRRSLLLTHPFDERFVEWGWEDIEFGMRVAERYEIHHLDNPVIHEGRQSAQTMLDRWIRSVPNFRQLCLEHPREAARLPVYRASLLMTRIPTLMALRPLLQMIVLSQSAITPLILRYWCWRLLRAAIYADAVASIRWPARHRYYARPG